MSQRRSSSEDSATRDRLLAATTNLIARDDSPVFWGMALGTAIPATIMGATALGLGVRNQRRHRAWA